MDIKDFEPLFGNWYVESFIGSGSFGKVYRIKREDFGTNYYSALKWISIPRDESELMQLRYDGMDNASISEYYRDLVKDLTNEMQLMSRLRGESNVVSYEDHRIVTKADEMGYDIFIRMELLTSLNEHILKHAMSRAEVIRLGIDMCEALRLCQKYNIIHRDIKPDNIFISETDNFKLGDFGIARQLERASTGMSRKGTLDYMAPEVYKGKRYNSSVDIYSLGIVLYRFLNDGRLPFYPPASAPIRPNDRDQGMARRMSGEQMPPPKNAKNRLGDIVLKACAYEPKDRYSSPQQMREELQSIQYSKAEAKLIYKDGDDLGMVKLSDKDVPPTQPAEDEQETIIEPKQPAKQAGKKDSEKSDKPGDPDVDGPSRQNHTKDTRNKRNDADAGDKHSHNNRNKKSNKKFMRIMLGFTGLIFVSLMILLIWIGNRKPDAAIETVGISVGEYNTFGVKTNGDVLATIQYGTDSSEVDNWKNIAAVSAGINQIVGLKTNATVVAVGTNNYGECDVSSWRQIVSIATGRFHTIGLKADGTVIATGSDVDGQNDVSNWTGITAVSAGDTFTIGLKENGTVVATGGNYFGQCNVADWSDIIAVSAGYFHTVGLKSDGTVIAVGGIDYGDDETDACNVSDWRNIVAISAGFDHTVGLKADGTAVAVGGNQYGQCDVSDWQDIAAIAAGKYFTIGLKTDGTVVATGRNEYGQCDVSEWRNVAVPTISSIDSQTDESTGREVPNAQNHSDDIVDATGYSCFEGSENLTIRCSAEETGLVFRSTNELHPYEMSLGVPLNTSALIQMIDYNSRNVIDEKTCSAGETVEFSNFPEGVYYFYGQCDGYEPYISYPTEFVYTESGYDSSDRMWTAVWLLPVDSSASEPFKVQLVDQEGKRVSGESFNFGVPDDQGNVLSCGWTTSNADGYLTTQCMIGETEYYDVLEFVVYNDQEFILYSEDTSVTITPPQTGDEVQAVTGH